jgi:hypothetical protein
MMLLTITRFSFVPLLVASQQQQLVPPLLLIRTVALAVARAFPVEIERPWESFISKISSLTLCSMTISSYVLFISPPIYIGLREPQLRSSQTHLYISWKKCGQKTFWNVFFLHIKQIP